MSGTLARVRPLDGPETLPARLSDFLRRQHPHHTVKSVQQALALTGEHVGADTVKNWVAGEKWPSWWTHLEGLMRAYGQDFYAGVLAPSILSADQLEEQRISRLEAEAADRRARLDRARQHLKETAHGKA